MDGNILRDFGGQRLQFVQIGLGTNSTCIQNIRGEVTDYADWRHDIAWLLQATNADPTQQLQTRGVSVDPMVKHVEALRQYVESSPNLALIHAAIGATNSSNATVFGVDPNSIESLLLQVTQQQQEALRQELEYIVNMSCMESMHHMLPELCRIQEKFNVKVNIHASHVTIWSWEKLVQSCNFAGCELLIVDTEGYDAKILRSMLTYCQHNTWDWPSLIQFETMGHCDKLEGHGTEWAVIGELESAGYILVGYSMINTHLVHRESPHSKALEDWLADWQCGRCSIKRAFPYISNADSTLCGRCCKLPDYDPQPVTHINGWIPFWQYANDVVKVNVRTLQGQLDDV